MRAALAELDNDGVAEYIGLARRIGLQCAEMGVGRGCGAVIVDPLKKDVVAVAGDARWWVGDANTFPRHSNEGAAREYWGECDGRVEGHALMRAVAMVAAKEVLRRSTDTDANGAALSGLRRGGHDKPLTRIEEFYFAPTSAHAFVPEGAGLAAGSVASSLPPRQTSPRQGTYLCSNLDIYLTDEPCVACSMALVHSRFRACVFQNRMPATGGLSAEPGDAEVPLSDVGAEPWKGPEGGRIIPGLGYGLFWRRELNWRVLAFQYYHGAPQRGSDEQVVGRGLGNEDKIFHA